MAVNKKICIIGALSVGKTSLVRRYVLNQFSPDYQATLGVNIYKYSDKVETPGSGAETINQIIWDVEGSQLKPDLLDTYLRGASGALVVGDVTRDDALDSMAQHALHFLRIQPGRPVAFALNKVDLLESSEVAPDGSLLSDAYGGRVMHTSAATGAAVPELFRALGIRMLEVGA
jgi:small GTP-binding protein